MWKSANSKGHHAVSLWERRKREERRHRSCSLLLETTPGTRFARIFAGELTSNWISCNRNLILFELRVLREFNLRFWSVGRISIPSLPRLSESVIIIAINLFFVLKIIVQDTVPPKGPYSYFHNMQGLCRNSIFSLQPETEGCKVSKSCLLTMVVSDRADIFQVRRPWHIFWLAARVHKGADMLLSCLPPPSPSPPSPNPSYKNVNDSFFCP